MKIKSSSVYAGNKTNMEFKLISQTILENSLINSTKNSPKWMWCYIS